MALRPVVVGVVVLLIVVSALAVVSGSLPSASPRASLGSTVAPAAGPIGVVALDQNGIATSVFFPGATTGRVYFSVTDPDLDKSATVRIYDQNATRDGLTNPVATWNVDVSTGTYVSTKTGLEYTLPTNLTYGGSWNVTASGAVGGFDSAAFSVQAYTLTLVSSPTAVLAGHSGTVQFFVTGIPSGTPYTVVGSIRLVATYYDGTTALYAPLALSVSSFGKNVTTGSASFLLPVNASHFGEISFEAWANVTSSGNYSVESATYSYIGNFLDATLAVQCNCVGDQIAAGSLVQLTVTTAMESYERQNAPGVAVTFGFWSGPNAVANGSIPGNPSAALTTGLDGTASILFVASPSVFSTSAVDQVNVSVISVPSIAGSAPEYYNLTYDFLLMANDTAGATIVAQFNAALYIGGDSGTATWQVLPAHGGTASGWSALGYELSTYYSNNYNMLATGTLSGLSGTINFTAPQNYSGALYLSVAANNQSDVASATVSAEVVPAQIVINPSEFVYHAGDTVRFVVETYGSLFARATIYETARTSSGAFLSSGVVTNDTFWIQIPNGTAPPYLTVHVTAQTSALGVFASAQTTLDEAAGVMLSVGISTVSSYSDGSFQPGQNLTVTWSESTYGPGAAPLSYWVELWTANTLFGDEEMPVATVLTNATSGSFQYQVPSGSVAGTQSLWVTLSASTDCQNYCYANGEVSFLVNPNPSVLNLELGAGSGVTVGWLILLIAIIVVAVVVVFLIRRPRAPRSLPAVEWKPVTPRTDDLPPPPPDLPPPPPPEPQ
jgi:hypothetical protein